MSEPSGSFRMLAEFSPDVIVRFDRQCRRIYVNPAFERLYDVKAEAALGRTPCEQPWASTVTAQEARDQQARLQAVIDSGQPASFDLQWTGNDGSLRCFELKAVPEIDAKGAVVGAMTFAREVTAQKQAQHALQRREQEFRALVELSPDFITRYDRDARLVYANPAFVREMGEPVDALMGKHPRDMPRMGPAGPVEDALRLVIAGGRGQELERDWPNAEGKHMTTHVRMTPEFDTRGYVSSVLVVGRDITDRKAYERRLERTERMARIGHWEWDPVRRTRVVSPMLCHLFGEPLDWSPTVDDVLALIPEEDRGRVQAEYQAAYLHRKPELAYRYQSWTARGELMHFHTHVQVEYDETGAPARLYGTTQDISEIKAYELRLHEMTFHDPLTGLPNRAQLYERLQKAIDATRQVPALGGLLLLDLDRFQAVNDTFGHLAGDRLLCDCAQRLRALMGRCDTVARLGGDEFAILVPAVDGTGQLAEVAQEVLQLLAQPFRVEGQELYVSASLGLAVFPSDGGDTTTLLQYADAALNDAKAHGRSCYRFYSSELTAKSHERVQLEGALRRAMASSQLELHYQPKVSLTCRTWVGAEALLRWRHPALGLLTPDRFIGLAEESGLIVDIGAWVLQEACEVACRWNGGRGSDFKVAVNLSAVQFRRSDVVAMVRDTLAETGCKPRWLELEITESLLLGDDDSVRQALQGLRGLGITIAIDDFGTGYSSLAYLKRFAIDVLKIDRSFIRDVGRDHDSTELVKAIISMARSLHMGLVAEGIEEDGQEHFLSEQGCLLGQGYLYARALPRQVFEAAWTERCVIVMDGVCPKLQLGAQGGVIDG